MAEARRYSWEEIVNLLFDPANERLNLIGGTRRNANVLHRDAITAADKLTMGALTVTDPNVVAGNLTAVAHSVAVIPNTAQGAGARSTGSLTPTANEVIRIAFAQVANAVTYDIFCSITSVNSNGLWVGRVTEAQRATGGQFTAVGTYAAGGAAGAIDIGIVGSGLASNVNPFANNNAYTPGVATIVAINCAGYKTAYLYVQLAVTDLRSLPTLKLLPFLTGPSAWHQGSLIDVPILTNVGQSLEQVFALDVEGSTGLKVLIDEITGQGAACSIWVELV